MSDSISHISLLDAELRVQMLIVDEAGMLRLKLVLRRKKSSELWVFVASPEFPAAARPASIASIRPVFSEVLARKLAQNALATKPQLGHCANPWFINAKQKTIQNVEPEAVVRSILLTGSPNQKKLKIWRAWALNMSNGNLACRNGDLRDCNLACRNGNPGISHRPNNSYSAPILEWAITQSQ